MNRYIIYISELNGITLIPVLRRDMSGRDTYIQALERNGETQYNTTAIYVEVADNRLWSVEKLVLDN